MSENQKPSLAWRLQAESIPDMREGLTKIRMRAARQGIKHRRRVLAEGPLINAVVAWFLTQPSEIQDRILRDGVAIYEAMQAGGSIPGGIEISNVDIQLGTPGIPPQSHGDPDREHDRPKRGRREKSGA